MVADWDKSVSVPHKSGCREVRIELRTDDGFAAQALLLRLNV